MLFSLTWVSIKSIRKKGIYGRCSGKYCALCLERHYHLSIDLLRGLPKWVCLQCLGICSCAPCRRIRGEHVPVKKRARRKERNEVSNTKKLIHIVEAPLRAAQEAVQEAALLSPNLLPNFCVPDVTISPTSQITTLLPKSVELSGTTNDDVLFPLQTPRQDIPPKVNRVTQMLSSPLTKLYPQLLTIEKNEKEAVQQLPAPIFLNLQPISADKSPDNKQAWGNIAPVFSSNSPTDDEETEETMEKDHGSCKGNCGERKELLFLRQKILSLEDQLSELKDYVSQKFSVSFTSGEK